MAAIINTINKAIIAVFLVTNFDNCSADTLHYLLNNFGDKGTGLVSPCPQKRQKQGGNPPASGGTPYGARFSRAYLGVWDMSGILGIVVISVPAGISNRLLGWAPIL